MCLLQSKKDQAHIFTCTCCWSFRIHLLMIVHHFVHISHDTLLGFVLLNLPWPFLGSCTQRGIFYCLTAIKLLLVSKLSFLESLLTIYLLIWWDTFLQHQTEFLRISQNLFVFWNLLAKKTFILKLFFIIFIAVNTLECYCIFFGCHWDCCIF